MAVALMYSIALAHFRRDYDVIRSRAESLMEIARANGFPYWSAIASMVIGRVLVGEGQRDAGIVRMREAMATLLETGGELIHNYALSLLAESYLEARETEKGLAIIAEARRAIEASGQRMPEAEIWRLRGELLIMLDGQELEAEHSFQRALETARAQQARSWELRAATSLARFLAQRDRQREAESNLAPIVASITEGFETADFKEAATLLGQLR
jgi:predicted ATPase